MIGSMHAIRDGYGPGAFPIEMLEADRNRHKAIRDEYITESMQPFRACRENPNPRDHHRARLSSAKNAPRSSNKPLSSGNFGAFDNNRKTISTPLGSEKRNIRLRQPRARAENMFLTSCDYGPMPDGSWRKANRRAQPHQEEQMKVPRERTVDQIVRRDKRRFNKKWVKPYPNEPDTGRSTTSTLSTARSTARLFLLDQV